MGYRNARFGCIEAHESVTAFARKILLDTLHIAEKYGFNILHGIVDCLWVQVNDNISQDNIISFCEEIHKKTGVNLELKGLYNWIVFLPLKSTPTVATLNHYYGVFNNGELKVRGLQVRKHDTPKIVKKAQNEILKLFSSAHNWNEFKNLIPKARLILNKYIQLLKNRKVPLKDLIIKTRLSRDPSDYVVCTRQAIAAKILKKHGIIQTSGNSGKLISQVTYQGTVTAVISLTLGMKNKINHEDYPH